MGRVAGLVATFALTVALAGWGTARVYGFRANDVIVRTAPHRTALAAALEPVRASADVVWLGDSTLFAHGSRPSYPDLVQAQLLEPRSRRSAVVAAGGLDFYAYYGLAARVLAFEPRLVVMVANLRMLRAEGAVWSFNDLMAYVPPSELPHLLALPYAARGMTLPRLLLVQLFRAPQVAHAVLFASGIREEIGERWLAALDPAGAAADDRPAMAERMLIGALREYGRPLAPTQAMVRFAGATVDMMTRRGVGVLVVVTPVPIHQLRARGWYDPAALERDVDVLRAAVESNGGALVDLHAAVPPEGFRDEIDHFTPTGEAEMARLTGAAIARELDSGTPASTTSAP